MEGYGYPYAQYPAMRPAGDYQDHGDGYQEYYAMQPMGGIDLGRRPSRTKYRSHKRSQNSRSASASKSRSRSRSRTRTVSRSKSRSRSRSKSHSGSRRELKYREPSFLDSFRVLYLTPSKSKKSTTKYLATKKRQDRIDEILKSDGFGSKKWMFYPRSHHSEPIVGQVAGPRDNSDQRVKIDGQFFKNYKRSKSVAPDAPAAKLKRWELIFYKKMGFIRAE